LKSIFKSDALLDEFTNWNNFKSSEKRSYLEFKNLRSLLNNINSKGANCKSWDTLGETLNGSEMKFLYFINCVLMICKTKSEIIIGHEY